MSARRSSLARLARRFLALAAAVLTLFAARAASAETARAWLYTIGAGSDPMSYYGHSAICVADARAPEGRCYDLGIADGGAMGVIWDSVRGRPRFFAVGVDDAVLVQVFKGQERSIWRQDLPLSAEQVALLTAPLEAAVVGAQRYAYHPYYDNCATRLRDALDAVVGGKLRAGADTRGGPAFRSLSERGFSGRALELAGLAIFVGSPSDRVPTAWESMFLPERLRDEVELRLGARAVRVYERQALVLPTSILAGRAALVLLGLVMAGTLAWAGRGAGVSGEALWWRIVLAATGGVLGALGLAVDLVALLSAYPELARNWNALVLLPSDLLLVVPLVFPRRAQAGEWLDRYLGARLVGLLVMVVLSAAHLVQPLVAVAVLAALPLGAAYSLRRRRRAGESKPRAISSPAGAASPSPSGCTTPGRTA